MITGGSNDIDSSFLIFLLRNLYESDGYPIQNTDKLAESFNVDLFFTKPYYGRINLDGDSISSVLRNNILRPNSSPTIDNRFMKKLPSAQNLYAMNFVVDAFEDFRKYYNETCLMLANITRNGPLANIDAKLAWESPIIDYSTHIDNVYLRFREVYLKKDTLSHIYNVDDFMKYFLQFNWANIKNYPLTYTNYVLSRFCTPRVSGLVIEIDQKDFGDDIIKTRDYVDNFSKTFNFYQEVAKRFGFFIDQHAPWRLIANLASSTMLGYAKKYALNSIEDIFTVQFRKNINFDIMQLQKKMYDSYTKFISDYPVQTIVSEKNCSTETVNRQRPSISYTNFKNIYNELYFLKIYPYLRAKEVSLDIKENKLKEIVHNSIKTYNVQGIDFSLNYVNSFFNGYASTVFSNKARLDMSQPVEYSVKTEIDDINLIL